ncbi:MAG: FecR family protein, partial [Campylobacterales bacterium]|nr:FecR family protein [Campylobacterales bacterium]
MGRLKIFIAILLLPVVVFASIGKISALNGDVSITRDSKVVKAVAGTTLEQKDIVKSSKGSTAQIVFNDNTVITVGSATTFKVEEYLFDEKTPNAKFKVEEGSFKTITGKIGKIAPDKFKLETKTATIGIRGTVFVGKIDGEGNLKIACTKGAIVVTPNLPNIPNTPPPPPTLVPEGQMTNADKKGVEPPRTYTPGDLKDLGGDLGGYAKRGGSNNQGNGNQDNKDKPTFVANDVKEKVGDSTNQIINTIVNNQTSGGSAWAAAYG